MADAYLKVQDNGASGLELVRETLEEARDALGVSDLKNAIDSYGTGLNITINRDKADNGNTSWGSSKISGGMYFQGQVITVENGDEYDIYVNGYDASGTKLFGPRVTPDETVSINITTVPEYIVIYSEHYPINDIVITSTSMTDLIAEEMSHVGTNCEYWGKFERKAPNVTIGSVISFTNSTTRISTPQILDIKENVLVTVADGYSFAVVGVDSNSVVLSDTGWKTSYTIPKNTKCVLNMKKGNNETITAEEATNLSFNGDADSPVNHAIIEINEDIKEAFDEITALRNFSPAIIISNGFPIFEYTATTLTLTMPSDVQCVIPKYGASNSNVITLSNKSGTTTNNAGSLYYVLYNTQSETIRFEYFRYIHLLDENDIVLGFASRITGTFSGNVVQLYKEDTGFDVEKLNYYENTSVYGVAHRGLSAIAPENSFPAFRQAREKGFRYMEFDVQWSSDGVPVIIHDATINRTARNSDGTSIQDTIYVNQSTLAELREYDYGIFKGSAYAGTELPTFEETIAFCRKTGMIPIIELKTETNTQASQIQELVRIVGKYGMTKYAHWLSYSDTLLGYVKNELPKAFLWLTGWREFSAEDLARIEALKTSENEVGGCFPPSLQTTASIARFVNNHIPYSNAEAANTGMNINALPDNTTYIFSENVLPEKILYEDEFSS